MSKACSVPCSFLAVVLRSNTQLSTGCLGLPSTWNDFTYDEYVSKFEMAIRLGKISSDKPITTIFGVTPQGIKAYLSLSLKSKLLADPLYSGLCARITAPASQIKKKYKYKYIIYKYININI
jgi:hypothetical protein